MGYEAKKSYSSSRPSEGGTARSTSSKGGKGDFVPTAPTHYIKDSEGNFVNVVGAWQKEGEYGPFIHLKVSESLQPGTYYLSVKKDATDLIMASASATK